MNLTQKLIADHLVDGRMIPGEPIALRIDQTLTQDATGTLVMLELEAMGIDRVRTELSAQYVDHNLLQTDFRNADDHRFLASACRRFGVWYSPAGNGVSHPVHMESFGVPGKTLVGSDSHTPAAGALGMLALGAGGLEVALAMAGEPLHLRMPEVWGVTLTGELPPMVSAKDVILELLRRHDVDGALGRIIEYRGPGLAALSAMDRHVIANMGTELGATSTVFPADDEVRRFLASMDREDSWQVLNADDGAGYHHEEEIELGSLEPLIALPSSPGNVVPVREVAGRPISQAMVGSSANPGFRDFAIAALMLERRPVAQGVSFHVNPTSRQILHNLITQGHMARLMKGGARIHQAGCNGCIGMGQAPATGGISLRTVPRNFPGRSGTADDRVYLCSPETATASAIRGVITDPRELGNGKLVAREPERPAIVREHLVPPAAPEVAARVELEKGPNIEPLPELQPLPDALEVPVVIKLGDHVSTDEIMPAGSRVLPLRSNIPAISRYVFWQLDEGFHDRALEHRESGSAIVAGRNYGQGSSREHAALAPRYLGVRVVLCQSFARIHRQNLTNFGILPLTFDDPDDLDRIEPGDVLRLESPRTAVEEGKAVEITNLTRDRRFRASHDLTARQREVVLEGSVLSMLRRRRARDGEPPP